VGYRPLPQAWGRGFAAAGLGEIVRDRDLAGFPRIAAGRRVE
jgi:hypothetical protein